MSSKPGNARNTALRKETAKATSTPPRDVARNTDADDARLLESDNGQSSGDRNNGDDDKGANDGDGDNNGDDDSDGGSGDDDGDDKNAGGDGNAGRGANTRGVALGGATSPSTAASASGDVEDDHHRSSLPSLAEIEAKITRGETVSYGEFRQMVDQVTSELSDIFEQQVDVSGSLSAPLERWETPLGVTLAPVIDREDSEGVVKPGDEIMLVRRPHESSKWSGQQLVPQNHIHSGEHLHRTLHAIQDAATVLCPDDEAQAFRAVAGAAINSTPHHAHKPIVHATSNLYNTAFAALFSHIPVRQIFGG
ncbi:hypothetical protein Poli38472_012803 [Pythium oligandrum]|uniref:Uncharacterized protein n=1 Tax=Pythium oligandrum TaxID=41045 RepID=A0A8K1CE41_PYTOL|nr:hypothetical protein Poli38472_012803 [Pythium oligandrum]|eukprot:TMW61612.1 hypothetical protein Poli38472_012803 [Pythium oligandrum]